MLSSLLEGTVIILSSNLYFGSFSISDSEISLTLHNTFPTCFSSLSICPEIFSETGIYPLSSSNIRSPISSLFILSPIRLPRKSLCSYSLNFEFISISSSLHGNSVFPSSISNPSGINPICLLSLSSNIPSVITLIPSNFSVSFFQKFGV